MKGTSLIIVFFFCFLGQAVGQTIITQPYLQDASPNSIHILWETDTTEESIVEWGPTNALGNETVGIAYPTNSGNERIHEVHLENLERFSSYYYRVKTGTAVSDIYNFKTPPFASDNEPFRILAMSDMQRDGAFPDKFREIVEEGVLDYLEEELGDNLIDNLALVMIPGDLVVNGNNYASWKNHFFQPAEQLLRHVPVYPVPGNHENDAAFFFTYFKLPENGTVGFEEHWWHKDYGNVRMIGLDSNGPYDGQTQLDWLDDVLNMTCAEDSIDFVFAQLHHPHKSELWTPGESNFTGEVIARLEQFSTDCGKPSIHFFGHTHGYSRGQSRDHKHLWINVATAGGAIDNWGEFPNFDYEEFSVSQDDYGFVLVEITNDTDPKMTIKRISRGDQDVTVDNQLTDSLTVRLHDGQVDTPLAIFPQGEAIAPECVTLKANAFSATDPMATHGQSHWQVDLLAEDFSTPVVESWKNFENWYFEEDTQANDDLSDERILGLDAFASYQWRVRYRDKEMNWSAWSTPVSFTTTASILPPNLLVNGGAETDLASWTVIEGVVEALESNVCNGVPAYMGDKYFAVGGLCDHSPVGRAAQNIDVTTYADSIDAGAFKAHFGGYLSNYSGSDRPEMKVVFLDVNGMVLGQSNTLTTLNSVWTMLSDEALIPAQTRTIQVELKGTRNAGTDNDSYFDDLFLRLGASSSCDPIVAVYNPPLPIIGNLEIYPNPTEGEVTIIIPKSITSEVFLNIVDMAGHKVTPSYQQETGVITIQQGELLPGTYLVYLRSRAGQIATGKLVVQ